MVGGRGGGARRGGHPDCPRATALMAAVFWNVDGHHPAHVLAPLTLPQPHEGPQGLSHDYVPGQAGQHARHFQTTRAVNSGIDANEVVRGWGAPCTCSAEVQELGMGSSHSGFGMEANGLQGKAMMSTRTHTYQSPHPFSFTRG